MSFATVMIMVMPGFGSSSPPVAVNDHHDAASSTSLHLLLARWLSLPCSLSLCCVAGLVSVYERGAVAGSGFGLGLRLRLRLGLQPK